MRLVRPYQQEFIEFAIQNKALRFGEFTLKSGRASPYFFNSGQFNTGASLSRLGQFYRHAIDQAGRRFDMLFGPAYKGIPLAAATAMAYADAEDRPVPYCFNRKEAKDHGEGGAVAGAPLRGKVLIIDDVITAGASVNFAVELIRSHGARAVAVVIALDRQERGQGEAPAIAEIQRQHGIPVVSIVTLDDLVEFLREKPECATQLDDILRYREAYGARACASG